MFWSGVLLGLGLAILVGPLVFTLIQASVEEGPRAGFAVAAGIWWSDLLFILAVWFGMNAVEQVVTSAWFEPVVGSIGGMILLVIGIGLWRSAAPVLDFSGNSVSGRSLYRWFRRGFLVNTVNPFTFFFWLSVAGGSALLDQPVRADGWLYLGIFSTILLTDSAKVLLAELIRHRLRRQHIVCLRRISSIVLIGAGIFLGVRVLL